MEDKEIKIVKYHELPIDFDTNNTETLIKAIIVAQDNRIASELCGMLVENGIKPVIKGDALTMQLTGIDTSEHDAKVRADAIEEINSLKAELAELQNERQADFVFAEEHDRQIRADAIDECLKVVEWDGYTLDIKRRIEQLKEKKE